MAQPTTILGTKVIVYLGDGDSPEEFAAPCGLTTKAINFTAETNTIIVPDCDDPDAPAWAERAVASIAADVSGSGVLAMESLGDWRAWMEGGLAKNIRAELDHDTLGGYWEGPALLATFNITGERGNKAQVEVAIQFDGKPTWVPAAP